MKLQTSLLFLALVVSNAQASPFTPIPLSEAEIDSEGVFLNCTLVDGSSLLATTSLVSVNHRILSKDMPKAFEGHKAQYLNYLGWQFKVSVAKQIAGIGSHAGVQIEYLDSSIKPVGTVENHICR